MKTVIGNGQRPHIPFSTLYYFSKCSGGSILLLWDNTFTHIGFQCFPEGLQEVGDVI